MVGVWLSECLPSCWWKCAVVWSGVGNVENVKVYDGMEEEEVYG